jgi:hypothetical protein
MTTPGPEPAERLVQLLETVPAEERQEITVWLLGLGRSLPMSYGPGLPRLRGPELSQQLGQLLPAGEESQLVTIRLPAERHAQLRSWCSEHGFTMAAVVRGLVERFLEDQSRASASQPTSSQP